MRTFLAEIGGIQIGRVSPHGGRQVHIPRSPAIAAQTRSALPLQPMLANYTAERLEVAGRCRRMKQSHPAAFSAGLVLSGPGAKHRGAGRAA